MDALTNPTTSPLDQTIHLPTGRLAWYVRSFQVLKTMPTAQVSVLDFAGADVSIPIAFGAPVSVESVVAMSVASGCVVGPRRTATWLRFNGNVDQINVSLFPGAAGALLDISINELVGRVAAPDDAWPRDFMDAVAELEPLDTAGRVAGLSALLLARLAADRGPSAEVREAVRLIHVNRGHVRVSRLAETVNLSLSQLERRFKRHVGVGPKFLARQTRVASVAEEVGTKPSPDWVRLAYKYGYADQAHLVREFHELAGMTPSSYARLGASADFLQDALACSPRD